ncbi:ASCH domain-containing protein [Limnoraphis robusta]|uniref:ASCH domain-containing protein n=1 Tax=Limnoraphis robusta TaxID=1118279 RepID=UPI002B2047DF|nr:ASCH domain-containing protein [Limnoraphis robusta]MEA5498011.1 ASCH domain-containing protein [Limnoraphis robusta BA-68 BA1]
MTYSDYFIGESDSSWDDAAVLGELEKDPTLSIYRLGKLTGLDYFRVMASLKRQNLFNSPKIEPIVLNTPKIEELPQTWQAGDEFIEYGNRRGRLIKPIESKQVPKAWLAEFNGLKCVVSEDFISPIPMEVSGQLLMFPLEQEEPEPPDPDEFQTYQEYKSAIAIWEQKNPELASMLQPKNEVKQVSAIFMDAESENPCINAAISPTVENCQTTTVKGLESVKSVLSAIATIAPTVDNPLAIKGDSPKTEVLTITLWQPWATLIAMGVKQIETRSWPTKHTGRILIHAAKRPINWDEIELNELEKQFPNITQWDYPLGAIVAEAKLTGCERSEKIRDSLSTVERICGNYSDNRYGWKLENVKPLLIPNVKGKQGLWKFDFIEPEPEIKPEVKPEIKERKCPPKGKGSGYIKLREANKKRNAEKGKPPSVYYLWYYSFTDQFGQEHKRSVYLKNSQVDAIKRMIKSHTPYTDILKWLKK